MITLYVFNKRGDDEPIIVYIGNITFKLYKGRLFVYGASKDCDDLACEALAGFQMLVRLRGGVKWFGFM